MLFKQAQEVIDGRKRQTRRPVKPWDRAIHIDEHGRANRYWYPGLSIHRVINEGRDRDRTRFEVGKTYAVQPGRGKKSIGRTPPLKAIRRERLQEISLEDIDAEGMAFSRIYIKQVYDFADVWNSLYRKPYRWEQNPLVWVLEFEPI